MGSEGSHNNVYIPSKVNSVIANLMELKLFKIPTKSALVFHWLLQYAGTAVLRTLFISYHMDLIFHGHDLIEPFAYAYGCSLRKVGEHGQQLPNISKVPTVSVVLQL